jgi:hypothetical protein
MDQDCSRRERLAIALTRAIALARVRPLLGRELGAEWNSDSQYFPVAIPGFGPSRSDDYLIGRCDQIKARFEAIRQRFPDLAQALTGGPGLAYFRGLTHPVERAGPNR